MSDKWDTANNRGAEAGMDVAVRSDEEASPQENDWLTIARHCFEQGRTVRDTDLTPGWERALRAFNNEHPTSSKYESDDYKHRSKIYRPKTRSAVRRAEAMASMAFFANQDVVSIKAVDEMDEVSKASADLFTEVMNYRLQHTLPWFLTCMGAHQTAKVMGVCVSKQYWSYREVEDGTETIEYLDDLGTIQTMQRPRMRILSDKPVIELRPPENVLIDRAADWTDPINSSPYLIDMQSMYVVDVLDRMRTVDPKTGETDWLDVDEKLIRQAVGSEQRYNAVSQAREGNQRQDPKQQSHEMRDHEIVWVHENIVRRKGQDWHFWTLSDLAMLSTPRLLQEVYPHAVKRRPYEMGYGMLEALKTYPVGMPQLIRGLQDAANTVQNLRFDNVLMAMTGRVKVVAGKDVNYSQVQRIVPGGIVTMKDPNDVTWDRPPDVTASAYQEQDRINVDIDELSGVFSSSSVQTNRKLNETVGGLELLSADANTIGEYDLRVFTETWVEPVLRQVLHMLQRFETDTTILELAKQKSDLVRRYGISDLDDDLLSRELTTTVNVGLAATDPSRRLQRLLVAIKAVNEMVLPLLGELGARKMVNVEEQIKEIMGLAGYKDGDRFYNLDRGDGDDPRMADLEATLGQLKAALETEQAKQQATIAVAKINADADIQEQTLENENRLAVERVKGQTQAALQALKHFSEQGREKTRADGQLRASAMRTSASQRG